MDGHANDGHVDPSLNPNHVTVTCETEGGGEATKEVSDDQYAAVVCAASGAIQRYPSSLRYLVRHADISPRAGPTAQATDGCRVVGSRLWPPRWGSRHL